MAHKNSKQHVATYMARHKAAGICVLCVLPAEPEHTLCRKHIDYMKVYIKERKRKRRELGLCVVCKEPAKKTIGGKSLCQEHIEKYKEYDRTIRANRKEKGLCLECKSPAVEGKRRGRNYCQNHIDKMGAYNEKRRALKKELGLCQKCNNPVANGRVSCENHLRKDREEHKNAKSLQVDRQDTGQITSEEAISGNTEPGRND